MKTAEIPQVLFSVEFAVIMQRQVPAVLCESGRCLRLSLSPVCFSLRTETGDSTVAVLGQGCLVSGFCNTLTRWSMCPRYAKESPEAVEEFHTLPTRSCSRYSHLDFGLISTSLYLTVTSPGALASVYGCFCEIDARGVRTGNLDIISTCTSHDGLNVFLPLLTAFFGLFFGVESWPSGDGFFGSPRWPTVVGHRGLALPMRSCSCVDIDMTRLVNLRQKQPTTNNTQPTTNNQQPTTNNQQPTTNNQQPTTNNQQPTTNNQQPATNKPTNQRTNEPTNQRTNEQTNKRTNEQTNKRTTNQPTNHPMKRSTCDRVIHFPLILSDAMASSAVSSVLYLRDAGGNHAYLLRRRSKFPRMRLPYWTT